MSFHHIHTSAFANRSRKNPSQHIFIAVIVLMLVTAVITLQMSTPTRNAHTNAVKNVDTAAVSGDDIFKHDSLGSRRITPTHLATNRFALQYVQQTPVSNAEPAWHAQNFGANIEAYFFNDGPIILSKNSLRDWRVKIHPMQLFFDDDRIISPLQYKPIIKVTENKIEYQRGILTEWYVNDHRGIEHGLVINGHKKFHTQNSLTAIVEIEGLNDAQGQLIDGQNIKFDSKVSQGSFNYSDLVVTDSSGNTLPAEFKLLGSRIAIIVDIRSAQFPINIDPLITTTNWETKGSSQYGESYGFKVINVGDVTGNGYSDALVSDDRAESGPNDDQSVDRGSVFLYEGSAAGLSFSPVWSYTETQLNSTGSTGARYGYALAAAGDINQDGFNDFIVSATTYSSATTNYVGRVYVYLGQNGGVASTPFTVEGETQSGSNFGTSVAGADVNGDGRADLVIGNPEFDNLNDVGNMNQGRVLVFLASPAAAFDPANPQTWFSQTADWSYTVSGDAAGFGTNLANAGDVDADGYEDIIVGSPGYSNGQIHEGAAYIFFGGPSGVSSRAFWRVESDQIEARLGLRVAGVGDVNGDQISDIMVSAVGWDSTASNEGKAYLFLGASTTGPSTTEAWSYLGGAASANLNSVAGVGDVNGDGFGDVIVGLQAYSNPESLEGQVLLFEGISTGLSSAPVWSRESNVVSGQIGFSVGGGGDFNGDGYSDIIVGAVGVNTVGTAYAFYGAGNSDLEVVVTDSADPVPPLTDYTYTLNISNHGPDPAKKVELVNTLPNNAVFQSVNADVNWTCNEASLVITCSTDNISANAPTSSIDIVLQYPGTASSVINTATINANIDDPNTANNSDSETTQINSPPIANGLTISTDEDVMYNATQVNDYLTGSDPDSDPIEFSLNSQASNGTATVQASGEFSYQPDPNFNGSDSFTYNVTDGITSVSATVNITVNAINDGLTANSVQIQIDEDSPLSDVLTAIDIDTPNNQLTYALDQNPQQGSVTISSNGDYTYTPMSNFFGADSFSFTVSDNEVPNLTNTGTVDITVRPVNDPPLVSNQNFVAQEDTALNAQLRASDDETPSAQLSYRVVANSGPSKGNVNILSNGSFTYTPMANQTGEDTFDFEVTDDGTPAMTSVATATITLNNTNDSPVAQALTLPPFDEDTTASGQLQAIDTDTPPNQLVYSLELAPTHGSVIIQNNGFFEYTPSKNYSGPDSFVFKVDDRSAQNNTDTAIVNITVTPVNDPPLALNGSLNIIQNQSWGGFLLGTDPERNDLEYFLDTAPTKGTVEIYDASIGGYTYTPNEDQTGPDSFTFKVFDGNSYSAPGTISVFINVSGSGNVNPSSPTLISPENNSNNIDGTNLEFLWQASVDPNDDNLSYKFALCMEDPNATCAPVVVDNQTASLPYSTMIAISGPGAGLFLFGLMGTKRRKQWWQVILLIGIAIIMSACSSAAEDADKPSPNFTPKQPQVVSHLVSNLSPDKTYYWKVIVEDDNGGESESEIRMFSTKP